MYKLNRAFFAAALSLALLLSGCAGEPEAVDVTNTDVSARSGIIEADPVAAIGKIYATLPEARTEPLTSELFYSLFPDLEDCVESFSGRISNPAGGLADAIIVKPAEGTTDDRNNRDIVYDALRVYQDQRIREFENYDILDATRIASDAEVFVQAEYVILLMLPDNEAARETVDMHIPL